MSQFPDRYPGIKAFEKNEANLFKGREQEVQELFNMVTAENCVVLFGKSGLGKSSLLNAGLSPLLEARGFLPISVRLQPSGAQNAQTPVSIFKLNIKPYAGRIKCESCAVEDASELPLWEYLNTCVFPMGFTPVFILDQFENFFSHNSRENQEAFLLALKELLHGEVPVRILNWYKSIPAAERTREQVAWCSQPEIRVIISIREDRLGDLGFVSAYILHILRSRYQLTPLTVAQAENAILVPAEQTDREYASPPFTITEGAKNLILKKLSSGRNTVETTHLQLICHEIECKRKAPPYSAIDNLQVDEDFFEGEQGLDDIINNFYARQIKSIINDMQREKAKTLLETKMVQNGKRVLYSEDQVNLVLGEDALQIISRLLDLRLIRGDYRDEQKIYEISHDSLLVPILAANKDREELEKELKIQQERAQRQKEIIEQQERIIKLQKQARLKKMATILSGACIVLLVILGIIAGMFLKQQQKFRNSLFDNLLRYADRYYKDNDHYTAYSLYNAVAHRKNSYPKDSLENILNNRFYFDIPGGVALQMLNDSIAVVQNKDNSLRIWFMANGQVSRIRYKGVGMPHSLSCSYPLVAYRDMKGNAIIYDVSANKSDTLPEAMKYILPVRDSEEPFEFIEELSGPQKLTFTADGRYLFTTDQNDHLRIYHTASKTLLNTNALNSMANVRNYGDYDDGYSDEPVIQSVDGGNWLAVQDGDNMVVLNTQKPAQAYISEILPNHYIKMPNRTGSLVYKSSNRLMIKKTGNKNEQPISFSISANNLALSPNGENLVFSDMQSRLIRVFSLSRHQLLNYSFLPVNPRWQANSKLYFEPVQRDGTIGSQKWSERFTMNADASVLLYQNENKALVLNQKGTETIISNEGLEDAVGSPALDNVLWISTGGAYHLYNTLNRQDKIIYMADTSRYTGNRPKFNSTGQYIAYGKFTESKQQQIAIYDVRQQKDINTFKGQINDEVKIFTRHLLMTKRVYDRDYQDGLVLFTNTVNGPEHLDKWYPGLDSVAAYFGVKRKNFFNNL